MGVCPFDGAGARVLLLDIFVGLENLIKSYFVKIVTNINVNRKAINFIFSSLGQNYILKNDTTTVARP